MIANMLKCTLQIYTEQAFPRNHGFIHARRIYNISNNVYAYPAFQLKFCNYSYVIYSLHELVYLEFLIKVTFFKAATE